MKIVQKKCPSCNGNLKLENGQMEGKCPYCDTDFVIDDEVIHVKHTVEIKDDYDIEMAITTLDKFKDYNKAKFMFRNLIQRYGHKKEVYIYLVRALTHDFTKKEYIKEELDEINLNFHKFDKLAGNGEVKKYKDDIEKINSDFWLNQVIKLSDNFNYKNYKNIKGAKIAWDNFKKYSNDNLVNKYNDKFNNFYVNGIDLRKKRNKRRFILISIITLVLVVSLSIFYLINKLEKPSLKDNKINYSTVLKYGEASDFEILNSVFKKTDRLTITYFKVNGKKLDLKVGLKNIIKYEIYDYSLDIVDDKGPVFESKECVFSDGYKVDLYSCIKAHDLSDGDIDKNKIVLDTVNCDFTKPGTCNVEAVASDSDNHETKETIKVVVEKAKLQFNVELKKDKIKVGESTTLSHLITPNVSNKKIKLEYDKNIISIKDNKTVKGLKQGSTSICVTPEYDKNLRKCVDIKVVAACKNSYTFKFKGSSKEEIVAGEDFCPGTYRFYAKVLNYDDHYNVIYRTSSGSLHSKYYSVWKSAGNLNDEGSKIAFDDESVLEIDPGITEIRLVK